jgi:hypothetical protein
MGTRRLIPKNKTKKESDVNEMLLSTKKNMVFFENSDVAV